MRLSLDCVRDVLLCVEENTGLRNSCHFIDIDPSDSEKSPAGLPTIPPYQLELQEKYSNEMIIYHILYCSKADLLCNVHYITNDMIFIDDLTPSGHDFVANIRNEKNHTWLKEALAKVGSDSIPVAMQLIAKHLFNM